MSLHQVNSAFNLLGQVQEPADSVRLPGPAMPTLGASCGTFHQSLPSNLVAIFSGPRSAKNFIYQGFFKDGWIEGRVPRLALLIALVLHLAIVVVPFPRWLTAIRQNPAFNNTELTWSGPVNDLPLPDLSNAPTEPARRAKAAIVRNEAQVPDAAAFHPRQRIFTDAVHPTHPRQTLINPKAPLEPPKILPSLPNIVQLQRSVQPAKPRMEIDEKTLAQLRPREHQAATAPIAPPPEVPVFLQQQADLTIQAESTAPVRPKLALNSGAAPRVAARAQSGDPAAAPELSEARADANGNSESTLIALSAAPAPPAANIAAPQGNLAARVSISPEGKPGASGASTGDAAADNRAGAAAGNAHSEVTVSISGGNPVAKNTMSGLGGAPGSSTGIAPGKSAGRLAMVSPHDMLARRPTRAEADETQERTGPPNFAALAPGAKPEQLLNSKKIYTLYVNMPNLSSATGSWILNFSEMRTGGSHQAMTTLAAPVLFKKVDPKYPPTLAADRVEGEIVLYAVIRKDGSVDSVQLVRGLDGVLDANSMTALSQWKFRPATREEQPVELETVVHIPFHATVPQ
jgi:TonB family protein